jgi:hypothetical protein
MGGLGAETLRAATRVASQPLPASWHAVETANFRILNYGTYAVSQETARHCEGLRDELSRRWAPGQASAKWGPKCELVLHPSDEAYLREVGAGGRNTVGSSLVDRQQGKIVRRRIDIRLTAAHWQTAALAHELTHLVLADRFADHTLPRWVDEGVAILSDPADKQRRHFQDLKTAIASRREFRLHEIFTLTEYPAAGRWNAFYGQSASLVEFLVDESGEQRFLEFVEQALEQGYEQGLQQVYRIGVAELERRWHAQLNTASLGARATAAKSSAGLPVAARPVSLHQP